MPRTASEPVQSARGAGARLRTRGRLGRVGVVALLFGIHTTVGFLGRAVGLMAGATEELEFGSLLARGFATDAGDAAIVAGPAAVLLVLLPRRWYRSFASWMFVGSVAFAGLVASVCVGIERAVGVVEGGAVTVLAQLTDADSPWVAHPLGMSFALAMIVAALLLGPVRSTALAGFDAARRAGVGRDTPLVRVRGSSRGPTGASPFPTARR